MSALVCQWIVDGTVSKLATQKRRDARLRQRLARDVLGPLPCISHPDSWFLWLPLADESRADRVAKILMDQHISVSTAEPFCVTPNVPQAIRVALGSVSMEQLSVALAAVRAAIEYEQSR